MKIRKTVALFISLVLLFSTFAVNASAETSKQFYCPAKQYYIGSESSAEESLQYYESKISFNTTNLRECLFAGFYNCEASIDISGLGILPTQENINAICDFIYYEMPEAFHATPVSVYANSSVLTEFAFEYSCTSEEYQKMYAEFEAVAENMTRDLKNDKLTDVQKALILHDRLAIRCEYDLGIYDGTATYKTYTLYGALVEGHAVCQGYAEAYFYLLDKVGIKNVLCSSTQINHVWNIVYIGGVAYHVDVTWDDPTFSNSQKPDGYVRHTNFLLSSNALYNNGDDGSHIATDYNTEPCDTTYDDYFWRDCHHETYLIGNNLYHLNDDNELCKYDSHTPLAEAGIGDIDGDKEINAVDASYCRRFLTSIATPTETQTTACDVNEDGKINLSDLVMLKKLMLYI